MRATPTAAPLRDWLAASFLLVLLGVGCLVLWIGIPIASMWAAGQLVDDSAEHFVLALATVLVGMTGWARGLFWLNRLYLRVRLGAATPSAAEESDPDDEPRWARGPLEPMLVGSLMVALVALFAWFFLLAENPSIQVI